MYSVVHGESGCAGRSWSVRSAWTMMCDVLILVLNVDCSWSFFPISPANLGALRVACHARVAQCANASAEMQPAEDGSEGGLTNGMRPRG
jgi:hypothetical protein